MLFSISSTAPNLGIVSEYRRSHSTISNSPEYIRVLREILSIVRPLGRTNDRSAISDERLRSKCDLPPYWPNHDHLLCLRPDTHRYVGLASELLSIQVAAFMSIPSNLHSDNDRFLAPCKKRGGIYPPIVALLLIAKYPSDKVPCSLKAGFQEDFSRPIFFSYFSSWVMTVRLRVLYGPPPGLSFSVFATHVVPTRY